MSERPLLLFPTPTSASRTKQTPGFGRIHKPSHSRQGQRLSPVFRSLQAAFNSRKMEVQHTASGIDPEQVLVIETIGGVEKFAGAVKRVKGFEWLGELDIDEIAPDEDFFDEDRPTKALTGRLFLVMANQQALNELLALWNRYQADPNMTFDRGLATFRGVFDCLTDIRRWDIQDRLQETGILDVWRADLQADQNAPIRFETELWFRGSSEKRKSAEAQVARLVTDAGGRILAQTVHAGIAYHGILAELPAHSIHAIIDNPNTELVKCDGVMFFRPVGQMAVRLDPVEGEAQAGEIRDGALPDGEPIIALLDGLPLANHRLLAGRVRIDDPDNWEAEYEATDRIHGTTMASLIVQGDITDRKLPLTRPIYVRPIMKPIPWLCTPRPERVPDNILTVDLIHRAVRRMFEGEGNTAPVAPFTKIVNLSIGDALRQFTHAMSPLGKMLDWLSEKYKVLFIVSAGNHVGSIPLNISFDEFQALSPEDVEAVTVRAIYEDSRNRKLLSPSESINSLTVGSVHFDESPAITQRNLFDPFTTRLPSPVTAFGSGYRRAVKPDLVFTGGKLWFEQPYLRTQAVKLDVRNIIRAPGNQVAYPGSQPGDLTGVAFTRGTSNATALISRAAGLCYDSLEEVFNEQMLAADLQAYAAPLLKAMLAHGCSWGEIGERLMQILRTPTNGRTLTGLVRRWIGNGVPQIDRVLECTENRATLLGYGGLSDGEANVYRLPLPPSLGSRQGLRRLTVTLAWLSPIAATTQKYRTACMWFEVGGVRLAEDRVETCGGQDGWRSVRRGTLQHEVFEGTMAVPFVEGDVLEIKVNCREDAAKILNPVPYGIAVSLEVAEALNVAVYQEIKTRIAPPVGIRPNAV